MVIVVKEILFRYVNRIGRHVESTAVQTDAWHHRSDALTSAAAFIGISVALIGGKRLAKCGRLGGAFRLRGHRGKWHSAFSASGYTKSWIPRLAAKLSALFVTLHVAVPGVIEVEKCRVRKMGLDFYVDLHVGVDGGISVQEGHEIAHQVKRAIQQSDSRIADVLVHIEPAKL